MSKLTEKEIIQAMEDEGVELTTNINEAIFILPSGKMISGMFFDGNRTEDHRIVEILFDDTDRYDKDFWQKVTDRTGMVQYVPESNFILLKGNQKPTSAQQSVIKNIRNVTIDKF